jgi:DNA-binding transcriptional LysR family regulator
MLERYLLRYFLAVVDQESFSKAAQQCCVSQPTLSVGIAKLEELLGKSLFSRSNRHVRVTAAGRLFLHHARRIENEFNLARSVVEADDGVRSMRVGVLNSIPGTDIARMIRLALLRRPTERFELVPGTARELKDKLRRGRIDLAVTIASGESDRFEDQPLRTESFKIAMPSSHPLSGHEVVAAEELAADVMIVRRHCESLSRVSRHFADRGVQPHFALRGTNDERIVQMISAGLGVTVMPESYAEPGMHMAKLAGFDHRRTLAISFDPSREGGAHETSGIVTAAVETFSGA